MGMGYLFTTAQFRTDSCPWGIWKVRTHRPATYQALASSPSMVLSSLAKRPSPGRKPHQVVHVHATNSPPGSPGSLLLAPRAARAWSRLLLNLDEAAARARAGNQAEPPAAGAGARTVCRGDDADPGAREVRRPYPHLPSLSARRSPAIQPRARPGRRPTHARGVGLARLNRRGLCDLPPNKDREPPLGMHKGGLAKSSGADWPLATTLRTHQIDG
jgi:hypothetical protein